MKDREKYELLLLSALEAQLGIKVQSPSADRLRRNLYVARRELSEEGEDQYAALSFSISPHDGNTLYIYRKDWKQCLEATKSSTT